MQLFELKKHGGAGVNTSSVSPYAPTTLQTAATRRNVAWHFDTQIPVGTYANGDRFVVTENPVAVVGTTPLAVATSNPLDARNGSELNTTAQTELNGFDGRILTGSFNQSLYDASRNIDPNKTGSSVAFAKNGHGMMIKAVSYSGDVSDAGNKQRTAPALQALECITFTPSHVPRGGFRPPLVRPDKTTRPNWTYDTMLSNMGLFTSSVNVTDPVAHPEHTPQARSARLAKLQALQYTLNTAFTHLDTMSPRSAVRGYGREWAITLGEAGVDLHSTISLPEKRIIAIALTQIGLDLWGAIDEGAIWLDNGGWYQGRLMPVLVAGLLLNEPEMVALALTPPSGQVPPFSEQKVFDFVRISPRDTYGKSAWGAYLGSSIAEPFNTTNRQDTIPFTTEQLGEPVWMASGYTKPEWNSAGTNATGYYYNYNGSMIKQVMAMGLLNTSADLTPLAAMFDHMSIWVPKVKGHYQGLYSDDDTSRFVPTGRSVSEAEALEPWLDIYLDASFARPAYQGVPSMCLPPDIEVFGTQVQIQPHGYEFGTNAGLQTRKIRWSLDDGNTWDEIEEPKLPGLPPVTTIEITQENAVVQVQVALVNAFGQGPWSSNRPNVSPDNASGLEAKATAPRAIRIVGNVDTSAPVLEFLGATALSSSQLSGLVTADTDNGDLYWVASLSASVPTATQIEAGQGHSGQGVVSGAFSVVQAGDQTFTIDGLMPSTAYVVHMVQREGSGNMSNVVSSGTVVTGAGAGDLFPAGTFNNPAAFNISPEHALGGGVLNILAPTAANTATRVQDGFLAKLTPGIVHQFSTSVSNIAQDGKLRFQIMYRSDNSSNSTQIGFVRLGGSTILASAATDLTVEFTPPAGAEWGEVFVYSIDAGTQCDVGPIIIEET